MNGVAVYGNIYGAVDMLTNDFVEAVGLTGFTSDTSKVDSLLAPDTIFQFNKLSLNPPLQTEINRLNNESNVLNIYYNTTDPTVPVPTIDPYIEQLIYFSNVMWAVGQSYGVAFGPNTTDLYQSLSNTSTAWIDDITAMIDQEEAVNATYLQYCFSYTVDIAGPAQIFLPAAGGLVIIAALLTVFRIYGIPAPNQDTSATWESYQLRSVGRGNAIKMYPKLARAPRQWQIVVEIWDWIPFALHMAVGIALCFCGFLDIPANTLTSPLDSLLYVGWALPLVAICYGGLMVLDVIILVSARKARGGRFMHRIDEKEE